MNDATEPIVSARGLTRHYKMGSTTLEVLRGVDLDVREGEMLAIVGSSGAGKSTLLHLLGLLDRPTSGEVRFRGRVVSNAKAGLRARIRLDHVGFVFQFYHLIPELTALENVLLARMLEGSALDWMRRRKDERQRAEALLDRVGLAGRMRHKPSQLSGGEKQRVAIARALVSGPDLVLCDEPTGNLDERTAEGIVELLFELRRSTAKTFVLVTHDRGLAARTDRVLEMHAGRISSG